MIGKHLALYLDKFLYGSGEAGTYWTHEAAVRLAQREAGKEWTCGTSDAGHSFVGLDDKTTPPNKVLGLHPSAFPYNVICALHEVAHTKYMAKGKGGTYKAQFKAALDALPPEQLEAIKAGKSIVYSEALRQVAQNIYHEEKLCWRWALKRARLYKVVPKKETLRYISKCLRSYQPETALPKLLKEVFKPVA